MAIENGPHLFFFHNHLYISIYNARPALLERPGRLVQVGFRQRSVLRVQAPANDADVSQSYHVSLLYYCSLSCFMLQAAHDIIGF